MWPSDLNYGMFGFEYEGRACGGLIKQSPEDFKVFEVNPKSNKPITRPPASLEYQPQEGGLFLMGRVWRRGMDHAKMVYELSKAFGVKEDQISTAGIKDAFAEIVQLFSVYQPRKDVPDPAILDIGLEIDKYRRIREKIYPGSMGGNYFEIMIRNIDDFQEGDLDQFVGWTKTGMLNYYGYQRFGGSRPITAEFGRALANGDYRVAVDVYLGGRSSDVDEEFRRHWRKNHDPDELLLIWNNIPKIEREMLMYLSKRPKNFEGAIAKIPSFLINIAHSAFISLLTNHYLSRRGLNHELLPGERKNNDNIEIALPSNRWEVPLNELWEEVFDSFNIEMEKELKSIRHTTRMLQLTPTNVDGELFSDSLRISFQLEPGQYATTVLRQLMQAPPHAYF